MKSRYFHSTIAAFLMLVSGLSLGAKEKKAEGFMTLTLDDKGKLTMELPKELIGREMLMSSCVEQTSHGGNGATGFASGKSVLIRFSATDSLVLVNEVQSGRYDALEPQAAEAVSKSFTGAVIAAFPIKDHSADSTFYRCDVTDLFTTYDKRLSPLNPNGGDSFGGLIQISLDRKDDLSMLMDVEGFENNMSVLSYETFKMDKTVLGMKMSDSGDNMTVVMRKSLFLLPETPMRPRIADPRIGVVPSQGLFFGSDDRGSKVKYYAQRRNVHAGDSVVFYVDTLFTEKMASAISKGVLKWNQAFNEMGYGDVVKVRPYPSDDPAFNANDLRYSCIKYQLEETEKTSYSVCADPRSGEILSSTIYVPFDVLRDVHVYMLFEIGECAPSLWGPDNSADILYEGLQADITRKVGHCLGLDSNFAGSTCVPVDSLRSVDYTAKVGLSGSIMDELPFNYIAGKEDADKGVRLVHTELGHYDKYAVKWIYGEIEGAQTPEDEVRYLDNMIDESKKDPLCKYVRKSLSRNDPRYSLDPRTMTSDLGDDQVEALRIKTRRLAENIAAMDGWLEGKDVDNSFRPHLYNAYIYEVAFAYDDVLRNIGGFYINEVKDGDGEISCVPVPASLQKEALAAVLEGLKDMSWLDNPRLHGDDFLCSSLEGFIGNMISEQMLVLLERLSFAETKYDLPFTFSEALDMVVDSITEDVRNGKQSSLANRNMQYQLVGYVMSRSGMYLAEDGAADGIAPAGFMPMAGINFGVPVVQDHRVYAKLKELGKLYHKAEKRASDEKLKQNFAFMAMAIDRYLSED